MAGDKGKFNSRAKEALEILKRNNNTLVNAEASDVLRARVLWVEMRPLEEKREAVDGKKYGNVAEYNAFIKLHDYFREQERMARMTGVG